MFAQYVVSPQLRALSGELPTDQQLSCSRPAGNVAIAFKTEKYFSNNNKSPLTSRGIFANIIEREFVPRIAMKQEIAALPVTSAEYVRSIGRLEDLLRGVYRQSRTGRLMPVISMAWSDTHGTAYSIFHPYPGQEKLSTLIFKEENPQWQTMI